MVLAELSLDFLPTRLNLLALSGLFSRFALNMLRHHLRLELSHQGNDVTGYRGRRHVRGGDREGLHDRPTKTGTVRNLAEYTNREAA